MNLAKKLYHVTKAISIILKLEHHYSAQNAGTNFQVQSLEYPGRMLLWNYRVCKDYSF
jgi:hypothetical protein